MSALIPEAIVRKPNHRVPLQTSGLKLVPVTETVYNPLTGYSTATAGYVAVPAPYGGGTSNVEPRHSDSPYTSPTSTEQLVWVPATPAQPGIPAQPYIDEGADTGWNAAAISVDRFSGDVVASVDVPLDPRMAVGFCTVDTGANIRDIAFGVLLRQAEAVGGVPHIYVAPLVNGEEREQDAVVVPHGRVQLLRIANDLLVHVGGEPVLTMPCTRAAVHLDVMLYTTADYADNPVFLPVVSGSARGIVGANLDFAAQARVRGSVPIWSEVGTAVDGDLLVSVRGHVNIYVRTPPTVYAYTPVEFRTGVVGTVRPVISRAAVLPPIRCLAADGPRAGGVVTLPALKGSVAGQTPTFRLLGGSLVAPRLGVAARMDSGFIAGAHLRTSPLLGLAADRPYCQAKVTLPVPAVTSDSGLPYDNFKLHLEDLELLSYVYPDPDLFASITSELGMHPTMSLGLLVATEYADGLLLDPSITITSLIEILVRSGITLSSSTGAPAAGTDLRQFGFNLDTGAATRYEGFEFDKFAYSPQGTYAMRKDGVYLLREGDDDGLPRSALVDFGTSTFGTGTKKHIETMYLGLSTDGTAYVKLNPDSGGERVYRVVQGAPTYRVHTGRGLTGREWSATLQILDHTSAELDDVVFLVSAAAKRWTR